MRNLFNIFFFCLVIISTIFFTREYHSYRPQPIRFVGSILEPFSEEGIYVGAKAYSVQESMVYLNRDLLHRGLQPMQVTIQNNSPGSYFLSNDGLDLPHLSSRQVAGKVTRSAIPRSIAFRVAGFFFWPLLIPGTIDTILTMKTYFQIKGEYYSKSIKDHAELILPFSTVNRVIFLPADRFSPFFTLYLQDSKTGSYFPFEVEVQN